MKPSEISQKLAEIGNDPLLRVPPAALRPDQRRKREELRKQQQTFTAQREQVINRVGTKIAALRKLMIEGGRGSEFAAFRFAGRGEYPLESFKLEGFQPGGVYMQPEDDRERMVDEMIRREQSRAQ